MQRNLTLVLGAALLVALLLAPQGALCAPELADQASAQKAPDALSMDTVSAPNAAPQPAAPVKAKAKAAPVPAYAAGEVWTDPSTGMEFAWVPGGSFVMGCRPPSADSAEDEGPVRLPGFWMGRFEVTQAQWQKVMGDNPAFFKKGDKYPVEQVSLKEAKAFLAKLNAMGPAKFRLPSEAEWEYAARSGGKAEEYAGGADPGTLAWHLGNSGGTSHEAGGKAANGLGLHDMSGNVWEWCEGISPTRRGSGAATSLRGGGWNDGPRGVCFARLGSPSPNFQRNDLGLRLMRTR